MQLFYGKHAAEHFSKFYILIYIFSNTKVTVEWIHEVNAYDASSHDHLLMR
jgi:hypothetical protein